MRCMYYLFSENKRAFSKRLKLSVLIVQDRAVSSRQPGQQQRKPWDTVMYWDVSTWAPAGMGKGGLATFAGGNVGQVYSKQADKTQVTVSI